MASLSTTLSSGCYEQQSCIIATSIADAPGAPLGGTYTWTVINQATMQDYGGPISEGDLAPLPNGVYKVRITASYPGGFSAASILHTVQVLCETSLPEPQTILVNWTEPTPKPLLGYEVTYRLKGSTDQFVGVFVQAPPFSFRAARGYLYEGFVYARCGQTDKSEGVPFSL